jgi:hypothetical protein
MDENSGLKAHRTLAPANARYARRQMMWGGKVRRERFPTAKTTEIAVMAGQKILFSGWDAIRACSVWGKGLVIKINNGDTIKAKIHAEIGTIAHLSIIGVGDLGRLDSKECIEALDSGVCVGCPPSAHYVGVEGPQNISLLFAIEQTCRGASPMDTECHRQDGDGQLSLPLLRDA